MAKIEMDISEYEAMKENKKLLEDSLEKERDLQKQIKELTDEKTKALEDAKMKVVKTTKQVLTEHALYKKDDNIAWREFYHLMGGYGPLPNKPSFFNVENLYNTFFEKHTTYSTPFEETTTHGLDDVKSEIRNELKSEMDNKTKEKLENAQKVLEKNNELVKTNLSLEKENNVLTKKNNKLVDECDKLSKKLTESENKNKIILDIGETLKNGYTFWNKSKILDNIISKIDDYEINK